MPEETFDAEKELADAMARIASATEAKSSLNLFKLFTSYT